MKTRREFSLEDWIRDARSWGRTPREKDYYEMNARTIISVWGDSPHLCDYANRDWDGLIESYYKVRWQKFFDAVIGAFDAGKEFDAGRLDRELWDFERRWAQINSLADLGYRKTSIDISTRRSTDGGYDIVFSRIPRRLLRRLTAR